MSSNRPMAPRPSPRPVPRRPARRWGRVGRALRILLVVALAVALLGVLGVAYAYSRTSIPDPNELADAQTTIVYYSDGTTELGRFAAQERTIVDEADIPPVVRAAFVAAEDRSFYENPGISPTGIARAAWGIVTREPAGGGSTITQQYVKNYFLTSDQTARRKATEILIALKIENQRTKDQILTDYLNTIYFGRGAYGIQSAAQAYFGVDVQQLGIEQAALLAGLLPAPSRYDPAVDPAAARERWDYVVDGLVTTDELSRAEADALVFPDAVVPQEAPTASGPRGYLLETVRAELVERVGLSADEIDTGGLRVVSTYDLRVQEVTEAAVTEALPSAEELDGETLPPGLRVGTVTLDPATGAVRGMWGGADRAQTQNSVTRDIAQAGSTFKPFTLVAALEQGIPLSARYNGRDDLEVEGYDRPVTNFGDTSYGRIDLVAATANSVNTVYATLNAEVGPALTRDVAVRAGLPSDTNGLDEFVSNVLGSSSPRVIDMAQAYATFAAQGQRHQWHTVAEVREPSGGVRYAADIRAEQVFDAGVMADLTYAMQQVVERGSGETAQELDRPVAGKTGTSTDNRSAWFIGYTPQLVTAVAMYQVGPDGSPETLDIPGYRQVTGGSLPTRIWTDIMAPLLEGVPVQEFPARTTPTATPRPTNRAAEPDRRPEPEPEPEPEPQTETEPSQEPGPSSEPESSVEPEPSGEPDPPPAPAADPLPVDPLPVDPLPVEPPAADPPP